MAAGQCEPLIPHTLKVPEMAVNVALAAPMWVPLSRLIIPGIIKLVKTVKTITMITTLTRANFDRRHVPDGWCRLDNGAPLPTALEQPPVRSPVGRGTAPTRTPLTTATVPTTVPSTKTAQIAKQHKLQNGG